MGLYYFFVRSMIFGRREEEIPSVSASSDNHVFIRVLVFFGRKKEEQKIRVQMFFFSFDDVLSTEEKKYAEEYTCMFFPCCSVFFRTFVW